VVYGSPEKFRHENPRTAALVIEVAISSEAIDREKGQVYAAGGVSEFWLVLPYVKSIEVYRNPGPNGYSQRSAFHVGSRLIPGEVPVAELTLSELFEP
jgi:Uma2 family endonuclease